MNTMPRLLTMLLVLDSSSIRLKRCTAISTYIGGDDKEGSNCNGRYIHGWWWQYWTMLCKIARLEKLWQLLHRAKSLPSQERTRFRRNRKSDPQMPLPRKNWERIVWPASNTFNKESIPEAMDRLNSRIQYVVLKLEFKTAFLLDMIIGGARVRL